MTEKEGERDLWFTLQVSPRAATRRGQRQEIRTSSGCPTLWQWSKCFGPSCSAFPVASAENWIQSRVPGTWIFIRSNTLAYGPCFHLLYHKTALRDSVYWVLLPLCLLTTWSTLLYNRIYHKKKFTHNYLSISGEILIYLLLYRLLHSTFGSGIWPRKFKISKWVFGLLVKMSQNIWIHNSAPILDSSFLLRPTQRGSWDCSGTCCHPSRKPGLDSSLPA